MKYWNHLLLMLAIVMFPSVGLAQNVSVTKRVVIYQRAHADNPGLASFSVAFPVVTGLTPNRNHRIEKALAHHGATEFDLDDERTSTTGGLTKADFDVDFNNGSLLSVTLRTEQEAAYPSTSTQSVVIDTRTGRRVTSRMIFDHLSGLAGLCRAKQRAEVTAAVTGVQDGQDRETIQSLLASARFGVRDLDSFSVNAKGVTFLYDYQFPHAVLALQPEGRFFFPWSELRPYIRRTGPLHRFGP